MPAWCMRAVVALSKPYRRPHAVRLMRRLTTSIDHQSRLNWEQLATLSALTHFHQSIPCHDRYLHLDNRQPRRQDDEWAGIVTHRQERTVDTLVFRVMKLFPAHVPPARRQSSRADYSTQSLSPRSPPPSPTRGWQHIKKPGASYQGPRFKIVPNPSQSPCL